MSRPPAAPPATVTHEIAAGPCPGRRGRAWKAVAAAVLIAAILIALPDRSAKASNAPIPGPDVSPPVLVAGIARIGGGPAPGRYAVAESDSTIVESMESCGRGQDCTVGPQTGPVAQPKHPVVGVAGATRGEWLASAGGGVFTANGAPFYGSAAGLDLVSPIAGIRATPDGQGYWLFAADGGVFTYGDAAFYGSLYTHCRSVGGCELPTCIAGHRPCINAVVALVPTPDGKGYWLVQQSGAVVAFGDAPPIGRVPAGRDSPLVDAADADAAGLWAVTANGGVFTVGDAPFYGSASDIALQAPVMGIAATAGGTGYWLLGQDGGIFTYGQAPFLGAVYAPDPPPATMTPDHGRIGTVVRFHGERFWGLARPLDMPYAFDFLQDLPTCEAISPTRHSFTIDATGHLDGWFVVPRSGLCFQQSDSQDFVPGWAVLLDNQHASFIGYFHVDG